MSDATLPTISLEAVAPAEFAALRPFVEAAESDGWSFRAGVGSNGLVRVLVAERTVRGDGASERRYDDDLGRLLAQIGYREADS